MRITGEIPAQEIAALKQLTKLENDAESILMAAREFIRLSRLSELKAASGRIEIDDNCRELEQRELSEIDTPK
jgi:hypothetical protein